MRRRFRYGHAASVRWEAATDACLAQLESAPGEDDRSRLGFLYVTDQLADKADDILSRFKERTGITQWIGSVGVGVCATGVEYLDEPAVVAMVGTFPGEAAHVFSGRRRPPAADARTITGAHAAHFAVVHGDPRTEDMSELVEDMATKLDSGYLVGGISSSRARTFQIANEVIEGGLSGAVFSSDVPIATRISQGCVPLPARHTITQCERNIIFALDNRPALDVLKEDIGDTLSRDLARAGQTIFAGLPVAGSDTNDYRVRNLVGIDPGNKLVAIGDYVEAGQALMFCRRDGNSAKRDLDRMLAEITRELEEPPRGALYFSCLGRGEHMFGGNSAELQTIRSALGEIPLVGFFANGEISHDKLYGYSGVLTLFV
jgi:small ligand-binding sensory domain FIST